MDFDDDDDGFDDRQLGGYAPLQREPCPPPGRNKEFDRHMRDNYGKIDGKANILEMRQAVWATWRTEAPTPLQPSTPSYANEDEELARVMELSAQEHQSHLSRQGSSSSTPLPTFDDDNDEDEELRRAIALSEEDARAPKRSKRDETPEEERRMLAEAMAQSLAAQQEAEAGQTPPNQSSMPTPIRPQTSQPPSSTAPKSLVLSHPIIKADPSTSPKVDTAPGPSQPPLKVGGATYDRAALERERLERQAARLAGGSSITGAKFKPTNPPSTSQAPVKTFPDLSSRGPSSSGIDKGKQRETSGNVLPAPSTASGHGHPFRNKPGRDAAGEIFLDGEIRHTALTIGDNTSDPTFSPQDVIGDKSQIGLIIMSSFVLDDEWMSTIMPSPKLVPIIMIRPHPKTEPTWNGKVQAQPSEEVRCYPSMVGEWGSAHMKFAWIFYKTGRLRIMIGTANMVPYDWEWIENTIFVQDFLQNPSNSTNPSKNGTDLQTQFRSLFIHLKIHKALKHLHATHTAAPSIPFTQNNEFQDMGKWDFGRVKISLVMSVPGSYSGYGEGGVDGFGLCRLGKVVGEEGWVPGKGERVVAEYQGSSLGQYEINWFDTFYQYCSGKSSRAMANRPKPNTWPPLKVLFPSLATIDASVLGRDGGGTMFCGKAWNKVTAPLFHDSNSKRGGVLMHAKMLIAIFEPLPQSLGFQPTSPANGKRKAEEMENDVGGWIYMGSHNFSSAAWGTINFKKNPPVLSIRNYELGIVFPLPRDSARAVADKVAPYKRPARKYSPDDQPWSQALHGKQEEGSQS